MILSPTCETEYGVLNLESKFNMYEGYLDIDGRHLYFIIDMPPAGEDNEAAEAEASRGAGEAGDGGAAACECCKSPEDIVHDVIEKMDSLDRVCREGAARVMLDSANDWLDSSDDEDKPEAYTAEMFMELMELESVYLNSEGCVQLGYADGDMFWGHFILVDLDEKGEFVDADIAG